MAHRYDATRTIINHIIADVAILDGTNVGPSDAGWQDVAGTLGMNLRLFADRLDRIRKVGGDTGVDLPTLQDFFTALGNATQME